MGPQAGRRVSGRCACGGVRVLHPPQARAPGFPPVPARAAAASPWLSQRPCAWLRRSFGGPQALLGLEAGIGLGRAGTTLSLQSVVAGAPAARPARPCA